jgi:undecaprenyl-diphosphatase
MSYLQAVILAIIEGITEFLPVSSTGHMIIGSSIMGIAEDEFTKTFTVAIQFGAILSVIVLYWKRFFQTVDFYLKLFVAFIPAAVFGKLLDDYIDSLLGNVLVVGYSLFAGGVILIMIDLYFFKDTKIDNKVTWSKAFKIGMFQVIAMIPGVSRSAATIVGGLSQKLDRQRAAEFSFFLAVPTMFAATAYKVYKLYDAGGGFKTEQIGILAVGNIIAFIVAMLAIKSFITFLTRHGFKIFGFYRIIIGLTIMILHFMGKELSML